jgi:hypothetical protein
MSFLIRIGMADTFARHRKLVLYDVTASRLLSVCDVLVHPYCQVEFLTLDIDDHGGHCARLTEALVANKSVRRINMLKPSGDVARAMSAAVRRNPAIEHVYIWLPQEPLCQFTRNCLVKSSLRKLEVAGMRTRKIRGSVEELYASIADAWLRPVFVTWADHLDVSREILTRRAPSAYCVLL